MSENLINCNIYSGNQTLDELVIKYVLSWLFLLLILVGIVGSIFCLVVIIQHSVFAQSSKYWFLSIIITDILILSIAALDWYLYIVLRQSYAYFLWDILKNFGCGVRFTIVTALVWQANVLQSFLSLERSYSIVRPLSARIVFTVSRTKRLIVLLVSLTFIMCTVFIGCTTKLERIPDNATFCIIQNVSIASISMPAIVYHVDLIIFRFVPYTIMFASTIVIIVAIQFRKRDPPVQCQSSNAAAKSTSETRVCLLLISMNILTLLTNPLFYFFEVIDGAASERHEYGLVTGNKCLSDALRTIFNCLMYFNNQTNWIFFIGVGGKFRKYARVTLRSMVTKSESLSESSSSKKVTKTTKLQTEQHP